jgi:hypothetical protein
MAGLSCAGKLMSLGMDVVVFDKGRGLGGRMATRRADGGFQFDHGVQYVAAKSEGFASVLERAEARGAVAQWPQDRDDPAFVGVPGMTGLAKHLSLGLNVRKNTRVERIVDADGRWQLLWQGGDEVFDRVVVTAPAPQIAALLPESHIFNGPLGAVGMDPCLTLMVGLPPGTALPFVSHRAPDEDISWIACDNAKPQRPEVTCVIAQASRDWSLRHLELETESIAKLMLPTVFKAIGAGPEVEPIYLSAHRWRYAFVSAPLGQPYLSDGDRTLFAGGDWCLGAKVEDAWASGQAIAEALAERA